MPFRRKVELAIRDMKRFASGAARDPQGFGAYRVIRNLQRFRDELASDPVRMQELLKAAQELSAAKGPGQGRAEEALFEELSFITELCSDKLREHEGRIADHSESVNESALPYWKTLRTLAEFAVFCLEFGKPRDSFGGRRRCAAFAILSQAGDGWEHEIKVEDIWPWVPGLHLPICLAGARACPPEDCGGVGGYCRVLHALRNPDDPKLREFRRWVGDFDPEEFDLERVNASL